MADQVDVEVQVTGVPVEGECALCDQGFAEVAATMIVHSDGDQNLCICAACYGTVARLFNLIGREPEMQVTRVSICGTS